MATVNEIVVNAIKAYPALYPNGYAVIDSIFRTIGGSYQWATDGTVELIPGENYTPWTPERERAKNVYADGVYELIADKIEERIIQLTKIVNNAETLALQLTPPQNARPIIISSRMAEIPENATQEWLNVIRTI